MYELSLRTVGFTLRSFLVLTLITVLFGLNDYYIAFLYLQNYKKTFNKGKYCPCTAYHTVNLY